MMRFQLLLIFFVALVRLECTVSAAGYGNSPSSSSSQAFQPLFSWSRISYQSARSDGVVYPSESGEMAHNSELITHNYIPENNVPMGVTRWRNTLFITMPRRRQGIPGTLNTLDLDTTQNVGPPLTPYPDMATNSLGNENSAVKLVSVYRTTADECNRLWFVDTGLLEYPGDRQQVKPAALIVFDLKTNQFLFQYEFPNSVLTASSQMASLAVDVSKNKCDEAFAYLPDLAGYGLIVYSLKQGRSWRFNHNYFHQDPLGGDFAINELRFQWDDGIFSIALSPKRKRGDRIAYFHAMASTHEYSVSTNVLKDVNNANRSNHGSDFVHLGDKGDKKQTSMSILDPNTGVLFYALVNLNGLGCWNTNKPFTKENNVVLFTDNDRFIYPGDITIDPEGNLWVLTNTMPYFIYASLNFDNVNFRVWKFKAIDLIKNTRCAS